MSVFQCVRFAVVFKFPQWLLFRHTCLNYSSFQDSYCCLRKGHEGHCHGDVSFDRRYKAAVAFEKQERARLESARLQP